MDAGVTSKDSSRSRQFAGTGAPIALASLLQRTRSPRRLSSRAERASRMCSSIAVWKIRITSGSAMMKPNISATLSRISSVLARRPLPTMLVTSKRSRLRMNTNQSNAGRRCSAEACPSDSFTAIHMEKAAMVAVPSTTPPSAAWRDRSCQTGCNTSSSIPASARSQRPGS